MVTKIKPERDLNERKSRRERWWIFGDYASGLVQAITDLQRVLVKTQVSRTWAFAFVPKTYVFDQRLVVFAFEDYANFTILQSDFHWTWAVSFAATLKQDMSYTPSDVFQTFPFPNTKVSLEETGKSFYERRSALMLRNNEGLTKLYDRFHARSEQSPDIAELRRLHVEMDSAVAAAYGWSDLELGHGFHETKQGLRYTIGEAARREVLDRLLRLNHERYAEEVAAGLHDKKKSGSGRRDPGSGKSGRAKGASSGTAAAKGTAHLGVQPEAPQLTLDLGDMGAEAARQRAPGSRIPDPVTIDGQQAKGRDNAYLRLKALLAQRGSLSNGEVQAALGIDGEAARRLLQRLVDEGDAAVVGQKRGTRYVWRQG